MTKGLQRQVERIRSNLGLDFTDDIQLSYDEFQKSYQILAPGIRIIDEVKSRGDQWAIGAFPSFEKIAGVWTLKTYSVITDTDQWGQFGGAFYCKIYPVSRFVEWLQLFHMKFDSMSDF